MPSAAMQLKNEPFDCPIPGFIGTVSLASRLHDLLRIRENLTLVFWIIFSYHKDLHK